MAEPESERLSGLTDYTNDVKNKQLEIQLLVFCIKC